MTDEQRREEVAALERMYALQAPLRRELPAILRVLTATLAVLDATLAVLEVFAVLFEKLAVTLFPFHKLLSKLGGRPGKESK